jgi:hypothetical protein
MAPRHTIPPTDRDPNIASDQETEFTPENFAANDDSLPLDQYSENKWQDGQPPELAPEPPEDDDPDPDLPLIEYTIQAIERNKACLKSQPAWKSPIYEFTCLMALRAELAGRSWAEAAKTLDTVLKNLAGSSNDPWNFHFGKLLKDHADPRAEFCRLWRLLQTRGTLNPLEIARRDALKQPLTSAHFLSQGFNEFISLAAHRQKRTPNHSFPLPVERVGKILGYDRHTIGTYAAFAISLGLLIRTAPSSLKNHLAAEYRCPLENWDFSTGKELPHEPPPCTQ